MEYITESAGGRSRRGVFRIRRKYGPEVTAIGGKKSRSLTAFLLSRTPNLL